LGACVRGQRGGQRPRSTPHHHVTRGVKLMKTIALAAALVALPLAALAQDAATSSTAAPAVGTTQGAAGPGRHHDWFAQFDTNGDGQISREEAQAAGAAMALKRFDK